MSAEDMTGQRTADELAIRQLTSRFNIAADEKDADALVATFVEEGILASEGAAMIGAEALKHLVGGPLGPTIDIGGGRLTAVGETVHATTDNIITIDGDKATQVSYCLLFRQMPDSELPNGLLILTERFDDELVRTLDGWRFAKRHLRIIHSNTGALPPMSSTSPLVPDK